MLRFFYDPTVGSELSWSEHIRAGSLMLGIATALALGPPAHPGHAAGERFGATLEDLDPAAKAAVARARTANYRAEFAAATTLPAIHTFIRRYAANDPDGYIPQVRERLADLQRSRFAAARTPEDLAAFIRDFRADDPALLIPEAQLRLAKLGENERAIGEVDRLVSSIATCKAMMRAAERAIAREREIEQVSGAVSLTRLHQAGEQLVYCRDAIPRLYASYRAKGGKRTLDSIN
jgi:hypothetical protein